MTTTMPPGSEKARARKSDPYTSHHAAAVATRNLPTHRALVLSILEDAGEGLTHEQIIAEANRRRMNGRAPRFTEQSLRSRCHELERDQLVVVIDPRQGGGRSRAGNPSALHVARSVYDSWTDQERRETGDGGQGALL